MEDCDLNIINQCVSYYKPAKPLKDKFVPKIGDVVRLYKGKTPMIVVGINPTMEQCTACYINERTNLGTTRGYGKHYTDFVSWDGSDHAVIDKLKAYDESLGHRKLTPEIINQVKQKYGMEPKIMTTKVYQTIPTDAETEVEYGNFLAVNSAGMIVLEMNHLCNQKPSTKMR